MSDLDLIETERLVLSGWRREQLDDLVRLHGDPEISRYFTASGAPWSREKCATRLDEWIAMFETRRLGKLRVTRKADGVMVGRAGFGLHGPTLQLVLWEDRHHPCGWGDYGYGYVMPDAVLYSQPGTPGGASGSWDFHVPTGSFADFPLRCGWAVLLLWGDGAKSSVLAQGIAQVVRPHFTGVKISALPPPVDPPIIPPVMPSHVGLITSATLLPIMTSDTDRQLETS